MSSLAKCVYTHTGSDQGLFALPSCFSLTLSVFLKSATVLVMSGTHQEAARDAIGHELALIGVPPPTTLDGFRPASDDEMKNFMVSVGLAPEQGEVIASKLKSGLGITSIVQFGWWFSEHPLKDGFHSHAEWRTKAPLFMGMLWALKTCSKMS